MAASAALALLTFGAQPVGGAAPSARSVPAGVTTSVTTKAVAPARALAHHGDDTVTPRAYPFLPDTRSRAGVPRKVRVLVMRVYWKKAPKFPDTGQTKALMKDTASWFARASRGRHHVRSKVTPWLRVGGGSSNCGDLYGSTRRAVSAARAHGTSSRGFNRFMLVMPQCGTNSQGEMPGRVTWIKEKLPHLDVLTHELGHNLGLDHANSLICKADKRRVTQGGRCGGQEYGDLWDAMGISSRPYSVGVLQRLGWAGRTTTTTRSGSFTLRDAEDSGKGLQALRVKVSRKASYWLEYHTTDVASEKQPGSFPVSGTPGLQIRLDVGKKSMQLLDAAPGNPDEHLAYPDPDLVNPTLPPGSSFTTPQNVRITLQSQDAVSAKVRVSFGKRAAAPDQPAIVSAVATGGSYENGARISIQPGASDNGQIVLGYVATRYPGGETTFVADPGGQRTTFTVEDFPAGPRDSGPCERSTRSGPRRSRPGPTNTFPRRWSPSPPRARSLVAGPDVHVVVDVQPDALTRSPITSMRMCMDENDCEYDNQAPWTVQLRAGAGSHTIRVRAIDEESAEAQTTSAPFAVVDTPPVVHIDSPTPDQVVPSGADLLVTATVTPNPATAPVEYVEFSLIDVATGDEVWFDSDDDGAPYSGSLYVPSAGTYRVEVVAIDQWYTSPAAVVTITANP